MQWEVANDQAAQPRRDAESHRGLLLEWMGSGTGHRRLFPGPRRSEEDAGRLDGPVRIPPDCRGIVAACVTSLVGLSR